MPETGVSHVRLALIHPMKFQDVWHAENPKLPKKAVPHARHAQRACVRSETAVRVQNAEVTIL